MPARNLPCASPSLGQGPLRFLNDRATQRAVVLPTSDAFFLFLSRNRARLAGNFLLCLPPEDVAERVVNKRGLYELAAAHGTAFPDSRFPASEAEAVAVKDSLRYPAFIKPYWGHQWRAHFGGLHKGFKVHAPQEFLSRFRQVLASGHAALVQSYADSADDNLFSVSLYVSQGGEALGAFARRQVRQYPPNSGTVTLAIGEPNAALVADATRFCQSIGYRGIAGLEYKRDREDGRYKLLDFNPRLMLSDGLTAYCGINLPLLQYLDLTGQRPAPCREALQGIKWLDTVADFRVHTQRLTGLAEAGNRAEDAAASSVRIADEASSRWQHDRTEVRVVDLLLDRRAAVRAAERTRREAADLDDLAAVGWLRRRIQEAVDADATTGEEVR